MTLACEDSHQIEAHKVVLADVANIFLKKAYKGLFKNDVIARGGGGVCQKMTNDDK